MSEKKRIRKYFPNHYKEVKAIPDEQLAGFVWSDIYDFNWQLRPGKDFVIRGSRRGRPMDVVERSFSSRHHARRYMDELFDGNYEVTVATNHAVFMPPADLPFDVLDEELWL